jgi:hypothetical protein
VLELGPAEQNQALCENKIDAIIFEAGHPNGLTQEATTSCRARLVRVAGPPIDRLLATHSYYIASVIPGGMYAGNPDDVPTIGTQADSRALAWPDAKPMEMWPMEGYVFVDPPRHDERTLRDWLELGVAFVNTLPPKPPRSTPPRTKTGTPTNAPQ